MQDKAKRLQAKQEAGPIEKKLNDAVEKVAKANGYDFIGCKFICIPYTKQDQMLQLLLKKN
jgi:hypothetical protein